MIKKILLNAVLFISIFWIALIFTMPKEAMWFKFEKLIYQKEAVIDKEVIDSNIIFLNLADGEIIFSGMNIANFETANILPLLFYNSISIKNIRVGKDMQQFKELSMDNLKIEYSVIHPVKIMLSADGEFGTLKGRINLQENKVDILIFPKDKFKKVKFIMKHFKKHENGGYVYNAKF